MNIHKKKPQKAELSISLKLNKSQTHPFFKISHPDSTAVVNTVSFKMCLPMQEILTCRRKNAFTLLRMPDPN